MWWIVLTSIGALVAAYAVLCLFYYVVQERLIFVRFRVGRDHRFRFPGEFEELYIRTDDGAELHALHFKVPDPKGVVLYFHGNTGSLRRWGKRAPDLLRAGFDVVMPDYRGYGKSRGRLSEEALMDDAQRWYDHVLQHWPQDKVVVYGRSLGSGMAVPLAATNAPKALILETPFNSLSDPASHRLPILPYRLLLRYPFRNDRAIKRVTCPILILHGRRDTVVPYTSALKLYAAIPPTVPRELVTFNKGHHGNLHRFPRFHSAVRRALEGANLGGTDIFAPTPRKDPPPEGLNRS